MASYEKSEKWMVFTSRCCLKIIAEGTKLSFGILLPALTEHFEASSATMGFLLSFHASLWYLGAPLAQLVLDYCPRPRTVTAFCGLLAGLFITCTAFTKNIALFGSLLLSAALCASVLKRQAPLLLHQYFPTNFAFISTSSFFGTITGGLVLPQLISLSLMAYGVSGALLIMGAMFFNLLPVGYALKVPTYFNKHLHGDGETEDTFPLISEPKRTAERDSGTRNYKEMERGKEAPEEARCPPYLKRLKEIFRIDFLVSNPLVSCTLIPSIGIIFIVIGGLDLFEVTYGISQGLELRTASFIPMASVTGCAVSHIFCTIILRYRPEFCVFIFLSSCIWMTLGFIVITLHSSFLYLVLLSFAIGVGANGVTVTYEGVIDFVVDGNYFADGSTLADLSAGLGILVSGFVAGYIKDITGSTKVVYWTLGGMNLVACLLIAVLMLNMSCKVSHKHH